MFAFFMKTDKPNSIVVKELKLPPSYYARTPQTQPFFKTIKQGYPISQYTPPAVNSVETFLNNPNIPKIPQRTIRPPEYPPHFSKLLNYPVPVPRDYPTDIPPPDAPFTAFHQNSEGFTPLSYQHQTSNLPEKASTTKTIPDANTNLDESNNVTQFKRDANLRNILKPKDVPTILPRPHGFPNSVEQGLPQSSENLRKIPRTPKFDVSPIIHRPPGTPAGFVENHSSTDDLATGDSQQTPIAKHGYTVTTPASYVYFEQGVPANTLAGRPANDLGIKQNIKIQSTLRPFTTKPNKLIEATAFPNIEKDVIGLSRAPAERV